MLHLIRNLPPQFGGRPIDTEEFCKRAAEIAADPDGLIGLWTQRRPTRTAELAGGSVYLVVKGETVLRMPFDSVCRVTEFTDQAEPWWDNAWAIVCLPRPTLVASQRVYRLRGWRYLTAEDAPADIGPA